jgi:hypothetical protein
VRNDEASIIEADVAAAKLIACEPPLRRAAVAARCVELFAGSARLSCALRHAGLDATAVDWGGNKATAEAAILAVDLATPAGQDLAKTLIGDSAVFFVFAAPPCGTASRARNRPVPSHLRRMGAPEPRPLRSSERPWGLADLSGLDALRVQKANELYVFTAKCARDAAAAGRLWCIENPANSFFWDLDVVAALLSLPNAQDTCFHNCMHGGSRDKLTKLRHNVPALQALSKRCDRSHAHEPWGALRSGAGWSFATAQETAYPHLLCERIAHILASVCPVDAIARSPPCPAASVAAAPPCPAPTAPRQAPLAPDLAAAADKQRRGVRHPQLIPEFKEQLNLVVLLPDEIQLVRRWSRPLDAPITLADRLLPTGSRLLAASRPFQIGAETGPEPLASSPLLLPVRARLPRSMLLRPGQVYVGRGPGHPASKWASPFKVGEFGRAGAVERYAAHLTRSLALLDDLHELNGAELVCHCELSAPCHADELIAAFGRAFPGAQPPLDNSLAIEVGIPWPPSEFVELALGLVHPFDAERFLDDDIVGAMFDTLTLGPSEIAARRRNKLDELRARRDALAGREAQLKASLDPIVAHIVRDKQILLLKEVLRDIGHPDTELAADIAVGFPLVGVAKPANVFEKKAEPDPLPLEQLLRCSRWAIRRVLDDARSSLDPEIVQAVWDNTVAEAATDRRWIRGPFSCSEIAARVGPLWVPSRRFGVKQGKKTRAVDDLSEFYVNAAYCCREKVTLGGLDEVVAVAKRWAQAVDADGIVEFDLASGRDALRQAAPAVPGRRPHRRKDVGPRGRVQAVRRPAGAQVCVGHRRREAWHARQDLLDRRRASFRRPGVGAFLQPAGARPAPLGPVAARHRRDELLRRLPAPRAR